jgi:hypothetical protein
MEVNLIYFKLINFKYFGTTVANPECVQKEGKCRLNLVSACKNTTYFGGLSGNLIFVQPTFISIGSLWVPFPMTMSSCCFEIYRTSL